MTVTYLKARATDDPQRYEALRQSDQSLVYTPFPAVQEFEMSLSVGDVVAYRYPTGDRGFVPVPAEGIPLNAGASVTVEVAEDLSVPLNLFGIIFPKGTLAHAHGVFCPTTKIDPGFTGRLRLLIFNGSGHRIMLHKGQIVGVATFLRTDVTVRGPLAERKDKLEPQVQSRLTGFWRYLARNKATVLTMLGLGVSIVALAVSVINMGIARRAELARGVTAPDRAAAAAPQEAKTS